MLLPAITTPGSLAPPASGTSVGTASGGFSGLLTGLLDTAVQQQGQADQAVQNLAVGQTDQVHNVLLDVARADLAFRLVLEVRNRLTEAYQEIMKMQF